MTTASRSNPAPVCATGSASGANCVSLQNAIALAAGALHTCALLQDGRVQCWGARDQIGDGDAFAAQSSFNPLPVCLTGSAVDSSCSALDEVVAIAAGTWHSCALRSSGRVVCWGWNWMGALGNGVQNLLDVRRNPVDVCRSGSPDTSDCVALTDVAAIGAGAQYSCALIGSGGMQCWGNGGQGQLGDPRAGANYTAPNPGPVCLTTVDNLCVPFSDPALRTCAPLTVEVAP